MVYQMLLRLSVALLILIMSLVVLTSASYFRYESLPEVNTLREPVVIGNKKYSVTEAAIFLAEKRIRRFLAKLWLWEAKRSLKGGRLSLSLALLERAYEVDKDVWTFKRS